uniref:Uncharacterized protein n=1 Tax=Tetranychus urticae TaxID=32264 RepID=T1KT23_TETUR
MANLIKNQVFKHLAKYFKNLSTDSFKLSAMKGFCELHNLELNEDVLMDLLELPVWLNITKATCSHAAIKIPWSKMPWVPICLGLDEVHVEVEITENFRTFKNQTSSSQTTSKYGIISRTIDGIRITISSVVVKLTSPFISASFQLFQLEVESRSPNWKPVSDLSTTTFKDKKKGLVINFKHIEWQTMKFEAKTESTTSSAPLKLICQGSCRVMIKKRISDCQVVGARIVLMFNDLLWVLTDAMLVSAFHFVTHINGLIKRSPITKKVIEEPNNVSTKPTKVKLSANNVEVEKYLAASKLFSFETSYHLVINCLQVQLCDDLDPEHGRSSFPSLRDGALGSRDNWLKYGDPSANRDNWIKSHLFEFADSISNGFPKGSASQRLSDLFSSVILLRIGDYSVKCVSTAASRSGGRKFGADSDERKLLSTGKFPRDIPAFYLEFNQFYYYEYGSVRVARTRPVPDPVLFANVAPVKILFDAPSLIWLNALQSNLHKPLMELKQIIPRSETNVTIFSRFEILMPTIIVDLGIPSTDAFQSSTYNIESIQINCSRAVITNSIKEPTYLDRLNDSLVSMGSCSLFIERDKFPWIEGVPSRPISSGFLKLMESERLKYHNQIWVIDCDPVWCDFIEKESSGRTIPLVDPFQITVWSYLSSNLFDDEAANKKPDIEVDLHNPESDVNIVCCIPTPIKIVLDHEGYLFLSRILEKFDQFNEYLTNDSRRIEDYHGIKSSGSPRISLISLLKNIMIEVLLDKQEIIKNKSGSSSIESDPSSPIKSSNPSFSNHNFDSIKHSSDPLTCDLPEASLDRAESTTDRSSSGYRSYSIRDSDLSMNVSDSGFEILSDISPIDDDDRSIRSDLSDSLIGTVNLDNITLDDEVYFTNSGAASRIVEEAMEATEAALSNDSGDFMNQPKREIVSLSLVKLHLDTLAVVKQAYGFKSSLLALISGVKLNELLKISYEEYKKLEENLKGHRIDGDQNCDDNDKTVPKLTVRLDSILNESQKNDLCSVNIQNLKQTLNNETLLQVLDFFNDPDATQILPILIYLQDVVFKLIDSSLKTPPLVVNLNETIVQRSKDNYIQILPSKSEGGAQLVRSGQTLLNSSINKSGTEFSDTKLSDMDGNNSLLDQVIMENKRLKKELSDLKEQNLALKNILDTNRDK